MTTKSSGFTLIELLVVVAIIGILSAVGIVSYNGYIKSAKRNSTENTIQQIALAQTEHYSNNGSYFVQGSATNCIATAVSTEDIEFILFDGEPIIGRDESGDPKNDFEICVFGTTASYTVYAQETKPGSTCVITVTKYGTPQRTGC